MATPAPILGPRRRQGDLGTVCREAHNVKVASTFP
jgi:hypothetical protein